MPIQIDIKMPKSCSECFACKVDFPFSWCKISKVDIGLEEFTNRPPWCQLKKVEK